MRHLLNIALCALLLTAVTQAESPKADSPQYDNANRQTRTAKKYAPHKQAPLMRATQIMDTNIQSPKGKSLGTVSDMVIDPATGEVKYAIVTFGGFLGVGDKMFAVPYRALECKQNPEDKDGKHIVVLDVTKKQMESARGFESDNWPDFNDPDFTAELDRRYNITDKHHMKGKHHEDHGKAGVTVDADEDGVRIEANKR